MCKKINVLILTLLLSLTCVNINQLNLKADETDTVAPDINSVSSNPETVGYGYNVTIGPNVTDDLSGVNLVKVNVTFPDDTYCNYTMNKTTGDIYEFNVSDTWQLGQYNYTIWTVDNESNANLSSQYSFNVTANATISVCTVKDSYGDDEFVNLTDPPGLGVPLIGYEYLDNGDVLHIWNAYDSYYFDTDSGIHLTNHYDEYWTHNVLMLGYYNNNVWNLIYRTDELSGFTKSIDTDNDTYINITIWKNLEYQGYDFRLAIRYHLGVDDTELTVIPYIKNIDQNNIPYILGFGWEMKDIQIDMTESGDYIDVNQTMYNLNQTLDNTYTSLSETEFYLLENISDTDTKSLFLKWNSSLTYKLEVKSREGQYNAPVTLFVRIGTLNSGQEKYTKMYWYDANEVSYYFDGYNVGEAWATNPSYMVDGTISNYASTTSDGDIELCNSISCTGNDLGTISKVELRVCAYYSGGSRNILLRPVFGGTTDGENIRYTPTMYANVWSLWFDITGDNGAPSTWTWTDVDDLDCDVEVETSMGLPFTMYCSKIEVRITYTPYSPPSISNPIPSNGATGISLTPILNITVTDSAGDSMDVSWLSNSSGTWQVFGTNNSASNGTYHQNFSNATENGKWWYWKVNVSDGVNYTESSAHKLYTGCESKIENVGTTNFSGYLNMQLQYYHEDINQWLYVKDIIDDETPRTFTTDGVLGLDTVFNGLVNTTNDLHFWNGTYRLYVTLNNPERKVLKSVDDNFMQGTYEMTYNRSYKKGWEKIMGGGFGRISNMAIRGMVEYNGELYVGTENHNLSKGILGAINCTGFHAGTKITMANGTLKNIEDIRDGDIVKAYNIENDSFVDANVTIAYYFTTDVVPNNYVLINNKLKASPYQLIYANETLMNASDIGVGHVLVNSSGSNVSVSSASSTSTKKILYNFEISAFPENESDFTPNNLTYFADDVQVYSWSTDNATYKCFKLIEYLLRLFGMGFILGGAQFFTDSLIGLGCNISDGGEIWKFNYTTGQWTEILGPNTTPSSGFGNTNNAGGDLAVYNGSLYFATGNYQGVEVWRYNGTSWEQVVGPSAPERDRGFDDTENECVLSMIEFTNETGATHLYAGTVNYNFTDTGFLQIWRTNNGVNWEKVVDKGFRDSGSIPSDNKYGVKNAYCWDLEIFQDKLYAGTFNVPLPVNKSNNQGCQLWRSASGNSLDWQKVSLPDGSNSGQYKDGFGEKLFNFGIRKLVNWSNNLYVGLATHFIVKPSNNGREHSCELWKYDGGSDWTDWECIVGDDSTNEGIEWNDGFGNYRNKYLWSLTESNNSLWAGTISAQYRDNEEDCQPLKIGKNIWKLINWLFNTTGCEVWRYDGTDLTPIVHDDGGEIGAGFGDHKTFIARYSAEYPEDSGNLVVGVVQGDMLVPKEKRIGCSIWMRHD